MSNSNFLQQLDTSSLTTYLSTELFYINLAKDFIRRLEPYKPKPVLDTIKTEAPQDKKRRRNRKTIAGILFNNYKTGQANNQGFKHCEPYTRALSMNRIIVYTAPA